MLKVKAKGHRDQVTVVGSLPSVSAGEWVTAEGRWVQDREFGLQFRAEMLNSTAPTTKEGIEKYLGSGMVKGIGPVYAKKLVEKFGEKIFDIIETGIRPAGGRGRHRPQAPAADQGRLGGAEGHPRDHGVPALQRRQHQPGGAHLQDLRRGRHREGPGRPLLRWPRTSTASASRPPTRSRRRSASRTIRIIRACAGLSHVLLEATGDGHCALPVELLKDEAGKLLLVDEKIVTAALERTLAERRPGQGNDRRAGTDLPAVT